MAMVYVGDTIQHERFPGNYWKLTESCGLVELSWHKTIECDEGDHPATYDIGKVTFPVVMSKDIANWILAKFTED